MITREEYNKALDVIEAYHRQLCMYKNFFDLVGKTPVLRWRRLSECSVRLQNVLKLVDNYNKIHNTDYYIETLTRSDFKKIKFAGSKSWNEFEELRGY